MTGRRLRLQIRYSDLDTLGHVNNAVYLTYFELGRIDYLRHSLGTLEISEISFVIAHAEVDFRRPIHFDDRKQQHQIRPLDCGRIREYLRIGKNGGCLDRKG
ncbi:acyl-CoA thioesterase [Thermoplasmatales archaeon AK]|nr:acyl-CoA thioesterase [Thermoplasmatales archaeon AK]